METKAKLKQAKRDAIKAAKDLGYLRRFSGIKEKIDSAETISEVNRVMITCRRAS